MLTPCCKELQQRCRTLDVLLRQLVEVWPDEGGEQVVVEWSEVKLREVLETLHITMMVPW